MDRLDPDLTLSPAPDANGPTLTAESIVVTAGRQRLVDTVDLTLWSGEVVGLLGPNGSGKSTLLRVLAGLALPASGQVRLDGLPLGSLPRRRVAATLGYLPQNARSEWPISVRETVTLGRTPYISPLARTSDADRTAVEAAMAATDVQHLADRVVTTLSGGERMRVMLARVLAGQPGLLLLDEPVTGLDPRHQLEAMMLLKRLADEGAGVLIVLHDLTLASRFCDRLHILREGRTLSEGPPTTALTPQAVEAAFDVRTRVFDAGSDAVTVPWLPADTMRGSDAERG